MHFCRKTFGKLFVRWVKLLNLCLWFSFLCWGICKYGTCFACFFVCNKMKVLTYFVNILSRLTFFKLKLKWVKVTLFQTVLRCQQIFQWEFVPRIVCTLYEFVYNWLPFMFLSETKIPTERRIKTFYWSLRCIQVDSIFVVIPPALLGMWMISQKFYENLHWIL